MAASFNKVLILGNLGSDPEVAYLSGGQAKATFNVATNDTWTDKAGVRQERTEWHRIVVWDKLAERCKEYLRKGRTVFVEGRLQTRQYDDKQGIKRYVTEITALSVQFIGTGTAGRPQQDAPVAEPAGREPDAVPAITDEDVPF
jgi:single-strand DNA-binding protein